MADNKAPARSVKEIEADLAARRNRLAGTVDELVYRTSPVHLKHQATEQAKAMFAQKKDQATTTLHAKTHTDEGDLDMRLIAMALAGVGGLALTLGVLRAIFHK